MTKIHLHLLLSMFFKVSSSTGHGSTSGFLTFSSFVYCVDGPALNRSCLVQRITFVTWWKQ